MLRAYRIRLPNAGIVSILTQQSDITGKELSELIISQHRSSIEDKERVLVRPPSSTLPPSVIDNNEKVELDHPDDILEFWRNPSIIRVEIAASEKQLAVGSREMGLDLSAPLFHVIPMFMKAYNYGANEPFVFKYIEAPDSSSSDYGMKYLNTNFALAQQKGTSKSKIGTLVIFPSQYFMRISYTQASEGCVLEGVLRKRSRNEKGTSKKKRIFVIKDNVMFYYSSKEDKQPCGFILLEYFTARLETENSTSGKQTSSPIILESTNQDFVFKNNEYILVPAEEGPSSQDWFDKIQDRCCPGGDTRVFGVHLKPLYDRYTGEADTNPIPLVIRKTINWIDIHGLEVEGIFRLSGTISDIEYHKGEFDKGKDVQFTSETDPHTVAGLLKLYLRGLPEPLITYNLYESFLSPFDKSEDKAVLLPQIIELITKLPSKNQLVLKYLCEFLGRVKQFDKTNKMTTNNLSIVFGPNILKQHPKHYEPMKAITDNSRINQLTTILIDENVVLFKEVGTANWEPKPVATLVPRMTPRLSESSGSLVSKSPYSSMPLDKVIKESVLLRKGKNKWKETLAQLTRQKIIFIYSGKNSKEFIELSGYSVGNSQEKPHCFVISKGTSIEYLCAIDSSDLKEWTTSLSQVLSDLSAPDLDLNSPSRRSSGLPADQQEIFQLKKILAEETRLRESLQKQVEILKIQVEQSESW
eukprot:TRINITY_DN2752_c0_g1_i1.p1 TRINITY_DN2752_c0_g1~~TRINITY_DN2752_c0_g1_i1.p1  ORF type:complete len:697 (+),score=176.45 TRINITY_DN2752_c0_g1_i1:196-2286(+)